MNNDVEDQIEIQVEGDFLPFSMVHHWIMLAPISDKACRLFQIFLAHINQQRGTTDVWPSREVLAAMLRLEKPSSVDRYIKELVNVGMIRKTKKRTEGGMRARNIYTIRLTPPEGMRAIKSIYEFYKSFGKSADDYVVPDSGLRESPPEETPAQPVVPKKGLRSPQMGNSVVPTRGQEQYELKQDEVKPPKGETRASKPPVSSGPKPHPLPEEFSLSDSMRRIAAATFPTLDVDYETAQFRDHYLASGAKRVNWPNEWQKWMRRSAKFASERATRTPKSRAERAQEATNALFDRAYQRAVLSDAQDAAGRAGSGLELFA